MLESRWLFVQSGLALWIFYMAQTTLYHYGACVSLPSLAWGTRSSNAELTPVIGGASRIRLHLPIRMTSRKAVTSPVIAVGTSSTVITL